ncbi:hypothetical protein [Olleya sp. Bg11-27]|uniref:hypothetical protein n=1 Tax=Olleya sp. Bg11-27 TaxID=2058135 RepID=UPI000C311A30|nr:hypothetical protein [Olleya sp. Bg11-27]AUC74904.1 hypothetical protein CW732_04115 [Olleya sp. Bg11-27]
MEYTFWIPIVISIGALFWNYYQQGSIEKLKRENQKSNLIHKTQFEKEFKIYESLWATLTELRNHASSLRPIGEVYNLNQSEEERKKQRLEKFLKAFYDCTKIFDNNKPFYPKEIYNEINNVIQLAKKEVLEYKRGKEHSRDYWENAEKNITEIIESTDNVCERIRERIGLIKIKQ